jgi:hypothetical protein
MKQVRTVCSFVAAAFVVGLGFWSPVTSASTEPLVVSAHGLNLAHLGDREAAAEKTFTLLLGPASRPIISTPGLSNCGLDSMASWRGFSAYFDRGRLVGISLGPGDTPLGRTSKGLELGDTLSHARKIYGTSLRTSTDQGGTWFVSTSEGRIEGFLNPSTGRTPKPSARILTIDVGDVGCPAMSP